MAKKKKKKVTAQPVSPIGVAMAAAMAGIRERMNDPEVQAKIASSFMKMKPQAEAAVAEMKASKAHKRHVHQNPETGEVADIPRPENDIPIMEGNLAMPTETITRGDRIQWFWKGLTFTVVSSYITQDSVCTEDVLMHRHGARKGDYTIDIIGFNGGAMFNYPANAAKSVAEYILSAIGWETVWPKHYVNPGYTTEGGEMAHVPHSDPGPAVPPPLAPYQHQPFPYGEEPPTIVEANASGWTAGFGDVETPAAAPTEAEFLGNAQKPHKCCGHCKPQGHAPHTDGCPSGFDL